MYSIAAGEESPPPLKLGNLDVALGGLALSDEDGAKSDPRWSKIGPDLAALPAEYQDHAAQGGPGPFEPGNPLMRVRDGFVVIDAVASSNGTALKDDLDAMGLQGGEVYKSTVSGLLPISAITGIVGLESLQFARPAYASTNVGLVDSQGDVAMRADVARATFGVDGTGITIGTLSDSYDHLGGAAGDVVNGDLPAGINVLDDSAICSPNPPGNCSDEGRGMMQLITDVAPGASQAFHTAFLGQASFATGIGELATVAGADVITDDVFYFAEPFFQDGIIAQAVDNVVATGVPYFSSAGNSARQSYESTFRPSGQFPAFGEAHDFDPGPGVDVLQNITVPEGSGVILSFQWNEPYFSVSGPPGSASDFDIYIVDDPPVNILAASAFDNLGGDPIEILIFDNPVGSGATSFHIGIDHFAGPNDRFLKYVRYNRGFGVTINEFDTASPTIVGHANATLAHAVGAAFFDDTPEFGTNPPLLEPFSSSGPTSIYFEIDGTPIVPAEVRPKPEIVAPDGTNTTFFGFDSSADPDTFPNFFGTSAAAPHAAAVAALMLELNPSLGFMDVYTDLQNTAIDMGPAGFDFDTGFGLIQADAALAIISTNAIPVADDQMVMTQQDTPVNITLTGSDADSGDTLSFAIASLPTSGGLMEGPTPINSVPHPLTADMVTYTPNVGFTGTDSFMFTATDGTDVSNPATVEVQVKPKPPVTTTQVFTYSVKITCVPHLGSASPALMPAKYRTAVNVHNPWEEPANIVKWVTLSPPQGQTPISGIRIHESLGPWGAFDVDCPHVRDEFGLPDGAKVPGGKGFMVIQSDRELDVVAVYSSRAENPSGNGVGQSIDIETIEPKMGKGRILPLMVSAYIDGRSRLILQRDTVHWHHLDFAAPGRLDFVNEPTFLNGEAWFPTWPDVPNAENRDCNCDSSTFKGTPPLAAKPQAVELSVVQARNTVFIVQHPDQSNNHTLIVEFDDNPPGGADWYRIALTYDIQ